MTALLNRAASNLFLWPAPTAGRRAKNRPFTWNPEWQLFSAQQSPEGQHHMGLHCAPGPGGPLLALELSSVTHWVFLSPQAARHLDFRL